MCSTGVCDAVVISLALMGNDYGSFLQEARRVLKPKGWLWVAEVRSRFADSSGKENFVPFLECMRKLGFQCKSQSKDNKMFVVWVFRKSGDAALETEVDWPVLKACVYKRR